jgi:hypothetical protein
MTANGEVPERLNGTVSKTVVGVTPPRVQIPASPPVSFPGLPGSIDTFRILVNLPFPSFSDHTSSHLKTAVSTPTGRMAIL